MRCSVVLPAPPSPQIRMLARARKLPAGTRNSRGERLGHQRLDPAIEQREAADGHLGVLGCNRRHHRVQSRAIGQGEVRARVGVVEQPPGQAGEALDQLAHGLVAREADAGQAVRVAACPWP